MSLCDKHEFDVFELKELTRGNELVTLTTYFMSKHQLFRSLQIKVDTFLAFITKIQNGYNSDVPYHNKTHGADVCQTCYFYLFKCDFAKVAELDDVEVASMLVAGACHDHEHPGLNNQYLIETKHEYATRYNDISVLENHHVASTFALANQPKYNIFQHFESADFKKARKVMIGCILATDMSKHFGEQAKFKSRA